MQLQVGFFFPLFKFARIREERKQVRCFKPPFDADTILGGCLQFSCDYFSEVHFEFKLEQPYPNVPFSFCSHSGIHTASPEIAECRL